MGLTTCHSGLTPFPSIGRATAQNLIRQRVLNNVRASQRARESSKFDQFATQPVAAKARAPRNPNVYEALLEAPISGTTRSAHRNSANRHLARQLQNNPDLAGMMNKELGGNVLQHMQSGRNLLNPPGTVWHHPRIILT